MSKSRLFLAYAILPFFSCGANAEPPKVGSLFSADGVMVACQEEQYIRDITDKSRQSQGSELVGIIEEYRAKINEQGKRQCLLAIVKGVQISDVKQLQDTYTDKGKRVHSWSLKIGSDESHLFILYAELIIGRIVLVNLEVR